VHNLIVNALVHNHPAGTVQVLVGPGQLDVINTGPIIAPQTVPLLFEPFRQTRARSFAPQEGAGLGLSIVASIARAHRAQTIATANPDGGLTVKVLFPESTSPT
jgi:signal transduction histidine kinase